MFAEKDAILIRGLLKNHAIFVRGLQKKRNFRQMIAQKTRKIRQKTATKMPKIRREVGKFIRHVASGDHGSAPKRSKASKIIK